MTKAVRDEIKKRGLDDQIHTTRTKCNGRCDDHCVAIAYPEGSWYRGLKPEDAGALLDSLGKKDDATGKRSHTYSRETNTFVQEKGAEKGRFKSDPSGGKCCS
ncbi:(2Fe-2S) ferredoxin domain-containing protein [Alteribacter natronophilus]|uniref:(2Fe-2S) ferredoxin domain-containing protein n=1 Tax=Alteribacter natronophilus TaxID=2583810 RepID=UPI00110ECED0|nr:(2Fe-2S) ferredoxin domain-containing protein [Alteribacter natronophilus]TMW70306.1 (2Fe-2S) ferredoxin domain-containing protein [Alteribacter natronophilus]